MELPDHLDTLMDTVPLDQLELPTTIVMMAIGMMDTGMMVIGMMDIGMMDTGLVLEPGVNGDMEVMLELV